VVGFPVQAATHRIFFRDQRKVSQAANRGHGVLSLLLLVSCFEYYARDAEPEGKDEEALSESRC
jgi:hypothetical protein